VNNLNNKIKLINKFIIKTLKLRSFTTSSLGLSYLNLSNYHSYNRLDYENTFFNKKNIKIKKKKISLKKEFFINKNQIIKKIYNRNINTICLTYLISKQQINDKFDFYFYKIFNKLDIKLENILFIYDNTTNINNIKFKNILNIQNYILLNKRLSPYREIIFFFNFIYEFIIFYKLRLFNIKDVNFSKFISKIFLLRNIPETLSNYRNGYQIYKIIKLYKPKNFFYLMEGKITENFFIKLVRKANKNTKIYGYQHSVITKNNIGIFRNFNKLLEPDKILTIGNINKKILKKFKKKSNVVGSRKYIPVNFSKSQLLKIKNKKIMKILFLPEGIYEEQEIFYNLAVYLLKLKNVQIIWRNHPSVKNNKLSYLEKKFSNFKLSRKDLNQDSFYCQFAIFRGSSSIIESMSQGVIPIYFKTNNDMNIDALNLTSFKHRTFDKEKIFEYLQDIIINDKLKDITKKYSELSKNFHYKFYSK